MLVFSVSAIRPSLQSSPASEASAFSRTRACLQHLPCGTCVHLYQRVEAFPLVSAERYYVTLYSKSFRRVTGDIDSEVSRRINGAGTSPIRRSRFVSQHCTVS